MRLFRFQWDTQGEVTAFTDQYKDHVRQLEGAVNQARHDGILFEETNAPLRQRLQGHYRDMAMAVAAAPLVEACLYGQERPFSTLFDNHLIKQLARNIARLEKPDNHWRFGERRAFVAREQEQARQAARNFLEHLDPRMVKLLKARLHLDVTSGKNTWSSRQFENDVTILSQ